MKIIVTGSRKWTKVTSVSKWLKRTLTIAEARGEDLTVVVGDCPTGVDAMTRSWCDVNGVDLKVYFADWENEGYAAGPKRNERMVSENTDANYALAFLLSDSRGTRDCISRAERYGLEVRSVTP